MRIFEFSSSITVIIDVFAWLILHLSISYIMTIPSSEYFKRNFLFDKYFSWEENGEIYDKIFNIKSWKSKLPDGGAAFKKGFKKRQLSERNDDYFKLFLLESKRAEMTHWIMIIASLLFFIWNPLFVGMLMIAYALIINLPCILAQRYNRPRLEKVIISKQKKNRGNI